jgi:branched-chain amino acid transport system ATP-binding protein
LKSKDAKMLLELEGVSVRRGALEVVRGVSLHVNEGEVVSVIGTNGAGKSSLMLAVAGLLPLASGGIRFQGQAIDALPAAARSHAGIALVPEGRWLFPEMTVEEHLRLGSFRRALRAGLSSRLAEVFELFPKLAERRRQVVSTLSGGEQQMVSVGRALMSDPRLLMLDEPSIGLAPVVVQQIFAALERVVARGLTVLLVEQDVENALRFSRRGYVLENGSIALEGEAAQLLGNPDVADAYLGRVGRKRD